MKYLTWALLSLFILSSCKKDEAPAKKVVSALELVITDPIPSGISKIRLTDVSDNHFSEKVITSTDIGKSKMSIPLSLYTTGNMDAKIIVYYSNGITIDKMVPDVKVTAGKKTVLSGNLFSTTVSLNSELDGNVNIGF